MAIPDTLAARLIETVREHELTGDFLMLGRQRWIGARKGNSARFLATMIERHLPGKTEADLVDPETGYSERFFEALGFASVESMDLSDFEGATIIHDLSQPVSSDLHQRFDVIYDGGTCEHVFNLPQAYANIDAMLRPGGVLIGHSPCNNWINHSFYQINPEMVFGFWQAAMGYEVLDIALQPLLCRFPNRLGKVSNPNETGKRPRISGNYPRNSQIILNYAVRKPFAAAGEDRARAGVYQTDYMQRWGT